MGKKVFETKDFYCSGKKNEQGEWFYEWPKGWGPHDELKIASQFVVGAKNENGLWIRLTNHRYRYYITVRRPVAS